MFNICWLNRQFFFALASYELCKDNCFYYVKLKRKGFKARRYNRKRDCCSLKLFTKEVTLVGGYCRLQLQMTSWYIYALDNGPLQIGIVCAIFHVQTYVKHTHAHTQNTHKNTNTHPCGQICLLYLESQPLSVIYYSTSFQGILSKKRGSRVIFKTFL